MSTPRLVKHELLRKLSEVSGLSESDQARACGYAGKASNRVQTSLFKQAIVEANQAIEFDFAIRLWLGSGAGTQLLGKPENLQLSQPALAERLLTEPDEVPGSWCGSTFAAFLDQMRNKANSRAWFIIDSDFGIGVIGPENSSHLVSDKVLPETVANWFSISAQGKRRLLESENLEIFRPVHPSNVRHALERVIAGKPVSLAGKQIAITSKGPTSDTSADLSFLEEPEFQLKLKAAELAAIKNSLSWRITKPLRALSPIIKKFLTSLKFGRNLTF